MIQSPVIIVKITRNGSGFVLRLTNHNRLYKRLFLLIMSNANCPSLYSVINRIGKNWKNWAFPINGDSNR